ncbi:S8 family serine peptidase [Sutcliffiella sp. NC1]|uniref:S8 family serine peptidase n=1 Tax=Sutcliffiella sp. NC1 TaxID=3004096 RepID=UPI0022DCF329|nr:S8 family serine peptidase [Sutcliffiella sp. NC1]WBL16920.1 S8 family serine peptidase [Sutcliffiella sp. NC1]
MRVKRYSLTAIILTFLLVFTSMPVSALTGTVNSLTNKLASAFSDLPLNTQVETVVDPLLTKALKSASEVEVIVTFWGDEAPTARHNELLGKLGIKKGVSFQSLPIAGVIATPTQVSELAALPQVRSLYFNEKLEYENYDATNLTGARKVQTEDAFRKANGGMPVSGKGVTVLVNDSGIDGTHKDLEYGRKTIQNVLGTTNLNAQTSLLPITYTENVPNTDTASHGTHVAGTVAGNGVMSSGKHAGVAPGASLVGYGSGAGIFILDTLGGFDYALTHQYEYDIRVITNSFGSTGDVGSDFDPSHPTNVATKKLYDRGIVVVFSAGNSGPAESTITGNFKKAPWVITVAAGDKAGNLASFSSRGVEGKGGTVVVDGQEFTWEDRPTVTAPGVDIISTRAVDALTPLGAQKDAELIETAHLPYYTTASGTSMAAPHVAGIVALMLDANPNLSPDEVKAILQQTATNIPGKASWEVGAGYVNAFAAVDVAFNGREYGKTLNVNQTFNSSIDLDVKRQDISIPYDPATNGSIPFEVKEGLTEIGVTVYGQGFAGSGNPINLVLIDPTGKEYSSGISLLFALYYDRTVIVPSPVAGTWTIEIRGLRGDTVNPIGIALPETVNGVVTTRESKGYTGLNDIAGHRYQDSIIMAVHNRLVDGNKDGNYQPDAAVSRGELAKLLVMGMGIRQSLPVDGSQSFQDLKNSALLSFAESVSARGGALKDPSIQQHPVMLTDGSKFSANKEVTREEVAYSLVQSLGLENEANARSVKLESEPFVVYYGDQKIVIEDSASFTPNLRGYVQLAFELNILSAEDYFADNMEYKLKDGEVNFYAKFEPAKAVTRAEYAAFANRTYNVYISN